MTPLTLFPAENPGVLSGRVTRIFRVLKPQPSEALIHAGAVKWCGEKSRETFLDDVRYFERNWRFQGFVRRIWPKSLSPGEYWVRETWATNEITRAPKYRADWYCGEFMPDVSPWRSPVTMPRWASRASIRVKDVRVHRVQDVTEAEALAAGVDGNAGGPWGCEGLIEDFSDLFNAINGPGSWEKNPWVVGADVERIKG